MCEYRNRNSIHLCKAEDGHETRFQLVNPLSSVLAIESLQSHLRQEALRSRDSDSALGASRPPFFSFHTDVASSLGVVRVTDVTLPQEFTFDCEAACTLTIWCGCAPAPFCLVCLLRLFAFSRRLTQFDAGTWRRRRSTTAMPLSASKATTLTRYLPYLSRRPKTLCALYTLPSGFDFREGPSQTCPDPHLQNALLGLHLVCDPAVVHLPLACPRNVA